MSYDRTEEWAPNARKSEQIFVTSIVNALVSRGELTLDGLAEGVLRVSDAWTGYRAVRDEADRSAQATAVEMLASRMDLAIDQGELASVLQDLKAGTWTDDELESLRARYRVAANRLGWVQPGGQS